MRTILLGLSLAIALGGCSSPEFYQMEPSSISFENRGESQTIRAVAKNRRGQVFPTEKPTRWTSSDESIVKVDENGSITAMGPGRARIVATRGKLTGEVLVDVDTVEQLEVVPREMKFTAHGDPVRPAIRILDARGKPMDGRAIRSRCLDEKVCTMDRSHQIWPHDPGETVAEIVCEDHKELVTVVVSGSRRR